MGTKFQNKQLICTQMRCEWPTFSHYVMVPGLRRHIYLGFIKASHYTRKTRKTFSVGVTFGDSKSHMKWHLSGIPGRLWEKSCQLSDDWQLDCDTWGKITLWSMMTSLQVRTDWVFFVMFFTSIEKNNSWAFLSI